MALLTTPIKTTSARNNGLLKGYEPPLSLNKAFLNPQIDDPSRSLGLILKGGWPCNLAMQSLIPSKTNQVASLFELLCLLTPNTSRNIHVNRTPQNLMVWIDIFPDRKGDFFRHHVIIFRGVCLIPTRC